MDPNFKLPDGFSIRPLTNEDIEQAAQLLAETYLSPFFDDAERDELRSIMNLSQRRDEILKRLNKLTDGKITRFEQMGHPLLAFLLPNRKEYLERAKNRVKKILAHNLNLLFGTFNKEKKIVVIVGAIPFNPTEFFKSPPQIVPGDLISYLDYLRSFLFAHHYLHDPNPPFSEYRQRAKPDEIFNGGPLGVAYHYRGSELGAITTTIRNHHLYKLGYRLGFGHAVNPNSGILGIKHGWTSIPQISLNISDFIFQGQKPFEALNIRWKGYSHLDNLDLCQAGFLGDVMFQKKTKAGGAQSSMLKSSL